MKTYDTVVVGAGLAGLTSALYLAKAGLSVLIVEKSNKLGGRAMTVKSSGALFNLGAHALYRSGEGWKILSASRFYRCYKNGQRTTGNRLLQRE